MTVKEYKPAPIMYVNDLETLKVLGDPLRNQILEILAPAPITVNQIAAKLGVAPSKLYYHVNILERHDLLRVVDTSVKGNIIEKRYWITAYECKLAENLCNFATPIGRESVTSTMLAPIDTTREDIVRSLEARAAALEQGEEVHPRHVITYRELRNVSDAQADQFMERIKELIAEFEELAYEQGGEGEHTRALTVAFYPSFYYDQQVEE